MTALRHPTRAVGLSYHGSSIIHSRVANADIQVFRIANSDGRDAEVDSLMDVITNREHPLAMYLFTKDIK